MVSWAQFITVPAVFSIGGAVVKMRRGGHGDAVSREVAIGFCAWAAAYNPPVFLL
ncbi:hypothetical protein HMPREF9080_02526 [Cardiobacterium valvarum F0432]|uniref:Uncharacterized protein n=1 Tax=Cardiobacterium valvarum F0432 TaxID=797473 RepID=G9ZIB6_9GAMM|nr:hypothetical protein HMPREF9080_02526 [Cardiobacterium valvarum F0432]